MICSKAFFLLLIFIHVTQAFVQSSFVYKYCENTEGNYTTNSTYKANLHRILSIFPSDNADGNGFYSSTSSFYGQSDDIHVSGLCRGDVDREVCGSCLNRSAHLLPKVCPNQKEAIGGFDECMLRYSNKSSFGAMLTRPRFNLWNVRNISSDYADGFLQNLRTLLNNLTNQASNEVSQTKFASGSTSVLRFRTIYAFVQCTPDLSRQSCKSCLEEASGDIPRDTVWSGGRVVTPSCNFRYEIYPFKRQPHDALPTSRLQTTIRSSSQPSFNTGSGTKQGKKSNNSRTIIISSVVPSVAAVVLIISIGVYTRVQKTSEKKSVENILSGAEEVVLGCSKCLQFDFSTIKRATDNFSDRNRIGIGGNYYRGILLEGQQIAVRRLKGNDLNSFIKNELRVSSKLQHRNLVRLLGFGLKGDERFLVYEYVPDNLERFIFDQRSGEHLFLDWGKRHEILKGVARGLLYLHEDYPSTIIHRDIKPSNLLLDENKNPKIKGFDLAMFFRADRSEDTTRIAGTLGYIAPEYAMRGKISVKADVYSFGVLLLEVVCGRKNYSSSYKDYLVNTVRRNWREGRALDQVDLRIRSHESELETIRRCIHIGLLCVQDDDDARPTMSSVVHMLRCDSLSLPEVSQGFGREDSPVESGRTLSLVDDFTDSSDMAETEFRRAITNPETGIRVAVLCWKFIRELRLRADLRRLHL